MTVTSTTARNNYLGAGATDTFSYTFKIFDETQLLVVEKDLDDVETTHVLNVDYTVTGAGEESGGTIVLTAGNLTAGHRLSIVRNVALTQATDFRNYGDFYAETHEDAFDKDTMANQQIQDELDRAAKLQTTDAALGFDATIPTPEALKILRVNDAADGFELVAPGSVPLAEPADLSVSTAKIQDDAVTAAKINADVAGDGLVQGGSGELDVNVDDSTIEIATDVVQVKAGGIGASELGDLDQDDLDAISGAASPAAGNVFATMNDLPVGLQADLFFLSADTTGASWSVDTGALAFTPKAVFIDWDLRLTGTVYQGWGYAHGTAGTDQNGRCYGYTVDSGPAGANLMGLSAIVTDANEIMGYVAVSAGAQVNSTAFTDESAGVSQFSSSGVIISTNTGAWASGGTVRMRMIVLG